MGIASGARPIVLVVLGVCGVAGVLAWQVGERRTLGPNKKDSPERRRQAMSADAVARANTRSMLTRLAKAHTTFKRKRLLASAHEQRERIGPILLELLREEPGRHTLLAVELAAELRLSETLPALSYLADAAAPELRAAAIRAAERLEPWSQDELARFARDRQAAVVTAALDVLATRTPDQRPLELIITLLADDDPRVRNAAVRAIPELDADSPALQALCRLARTANPRAAQAAAAALGRTGVPVTAEAALLALLDNSDVLVRDEALVALSRLPRSIADPTRVFELLTRADTTVETAILGFISLEATQTIPVERFKELLPGLHPFVRMYAARGLVAAGERSGVRVLIDLLELRESAEVDDEQVDCAHSHSRIVLTEVAGRDLGSAKAPWLRWFETLIEMAPRRLTSKPPTLW